MSGNPNAVTTTFTYEPTYSRVASVVDPLGHTSTFAYDSLSNLVRALLIMGLPRLESTKR